MHSPIQAQKYHHSTTIAYKEICFDSVRLYGQVQLCSVLCGLTISGWSEKVGAGEQMLRELKCLCSLVTFCSSIINCGDKIHNMSSFILT